MTGYIGFGNETLKKQKVVHAGDIVTCPCGHDHALEMATDDKGQKTEFLMFYKCGDKTFLAAVDNRLIIYTEADIHGDM